MIHVWTDGCCLKNPGGAGGWAYVVADEHNTVLCKHSGGERSTTNNRMEMEAVLHGIRRARLMFPKDDIEVISDSRYVVNGASEWMQSWKRKGWKKRGKPVKNADLWKAIDDALDDQVTLLWVRGHTGVHLNEVCDFMAKEAAGVFA